MTIFSKIITENFWKDKKIKGLYDTFVAFAYRKKKEKINMVESCKIVILLVSNISFYINLINSAQLIWETRGPKGP